MDQSTPKQLPLAAGNANISTPAGIKTFLLCRALNFKSRALPIEVRQSDGRECLAFTKTLNTNPRPWQEGKAAEHDPLSNKRAL